jgi:hypothetical protein
MRAGGGHIPGGAHIKARLGPDLLLEEHVGDPQLDHPVHGLLIFEALLEADVPVCIIKYR